MKTYMLQDSGNLKELVVQAQGADEPLVVFDGEDECLVVMRPPVFERLLFDADSLAREGRRSLHL